MGVGGGEGGGGGGVGGGYVLCLMSWRLVSHCLMISVPSRDISMISRVISCVNRPVNIAHYTSTDIKQPPGYYWLSFFITSLVYCQTGLQSLVSRR